MHPHRRELWVKATALACLMVGSVLTGAAIVRWAPNTASDGRSSHPWIRPAHDPPPSPGFTLDPHQHPTWPLAVVEYGLGALLLWMPLVLLGSPIGHKGQARIEAGWAILVVLSTVAAVLVSLMTISAVKGLIAAA